MAPPTLSPSSVSSSSATEAGGPRALLLRMFEDAVAAVAASRCVPPHLPPPAPGRTLVVGAGKASAAMAQAVERHWRGELSGLVVTPYAHGVTLSRVRVVEAAHPVPDAAGAAAARRILEKVGNLGENDLVLCLLSGGGSALMSLPVKGVRLEDKQAVTAALLKSGATIAEINCVRKHLSRIKGGRLAAAAAPAPVCALLISDVPGDDPAVIASGPTVPDPTTFADALGVLERYGIDGPPRVLAHLRKGADETPKPGDPRLARAQSVIVARPRQAFAAAARVAREAGFEAVMLGDDLEGEARAVAQHHARLALRELRHGRRVALLSGGETTVTVTGSGRGGPNAEYLLALAAALGGAPGGAPGVWAIACDTDGIDGLGDNAGATISPETLARARVLGLDPARHLADNDSYGFFSALGDLVITGPTRTNVNDFRAILIAPTPN